MKMTPNNKKIAVFGSGSWATSIMKILCENASEVGWYVWQQETVDYIEENAHNRDYSSSIEFNTEQLYLSNDIDEMIRYADILILVIPSAFVKKELDKITADLSDKTIFTAIKGIIPENGLVVGEYLCEKFSIPSHNIGVISGPCHAEEIALERLSYLTVSCRRKKKAKEMAALLTTDYVKVRTSKDVIGSEYSAVLKNIYAVAAGICHGLGYGDNFQAVLMSNSIREMKRFVSHLSSAKRNINNSAYLGDLLVTGYSVFSRNRTFGSMIGKGYSVKSAITEMTMIAEGYYATKSAYKIKQKYSIKTPIIDAVYSILYEQKNPKKVIKKLTTLIN